MLKMLSTVFKRVERAFYQIVLRNHMIANNQPPSVLERIRAIPAHPRLRDWMVPCYEVEGLRIVRVLDYDIYFAIKDGKDDTPAMVQHLKAYEVERLKNDPSYAKKLDSLTWKTLDECDTAFSERFLKIVNVLHILRTDRN